MAFAGYGRSANGSPVKLYGNRVEGDREPVVAGKLASNETNHTTVEVYIAGEPTTVAVTEIVAWSQFSANAFDVVLLGGGKGRSFDGNFLARVC